MAKVAEELAFEVVGPLGLLQAGAQGCHRLLQRLDLLPVLAQLPVQAGQAQPGSNRQQQQGSDAYRQQGRGHGQGIRHIGEVAGWRFISMRYAWPCPPAHSSKWSPVSA